MNPTKTFTPLSQIPKATIGKCTAVLPNHMQCWKAGDVEVKTVTTYTEIAIHNLKIESDGEMTATQGAETTKTEVSTYQLCRAHAIAEQQEYDRAVADEAALKAAEATAAKDTKK